MVQLSIIIVNWNTKTYLENCINSIYENTKELTYEIIVVDNASKDGSSQLVREKFNNVILIENQANRGFNAANNQGISISKANYILLLNPDTIILPNALSAMVRFMQGHQDAGALGCKILNPDRSVHFYFRKNPTLFKETKKLLLPERFVLEENKTKAEDYESIHEVEVLSGCCLMIRKEVFERTGLLDERFFMYGDDVDLCYQVRKAGLKIYYTPQAEIIHFGKKSTDKCRPEMAIESYKSVYKLLEKIYGRFKAELFRILALIISCLKIFLWFIFYLLGVKRQSMRERLKAHSGVIKAFWQMGKERKDEHSPCIVWVVGFAPEKMGSFEDLILRMAKEAKERKIKFVVVFPDYPIKRLEELLMAEGADIKILPVRKRTDFLYFLRLGFFIRKEKATVLHGHFALATLATLMANFIGQAPVYIWHQHNLTGAHLFLIRNLFFKFLSWRATKIIAVSDAVKRDLVAKGAEEHKIQVIANGIDLNRFIFHGQRERSLEIKKNLGIKAEEPVIAAVAMARPEKGHSFLLKAFVQILAYFTNARLLFIGAKSGPLTEYLIKQTKELGIQNKVIFTEVRSDVEHILPEIDILAIPSILEGMPYSALEGMACAKPIVAFSVGGLPDLVRDGETGFLIPPEDTKELAKKISDLLSSAALREKMGKAARKFVEENFSLEKMVANIFELYGIKQEKMSDG